MEQNSKPIKTWLHGSSGRMGVELQKLLTNHQIFRLVGGSSENCWGKWIEDSFLSVNFQEVSPLFSEVDLYVDFSSPQGNAELLKTLLASAVTGKAILIATTGLSVEQTDLWRTAAKERNFKILFASNTSYGVILVTQMCLEMASYLHGHDFDIEICETHHKAKLDAPSGTARYIAERLAHQEKLNVNFCRTQARLPDEIGVTSMRGGSVFVEHTIRFLGEHEEISITHRAMSRGLFAKGAIILAKWLLTQSSGVFELKDVSLSAQN